MPQYSYEDLEQIDVNAIRNPVILSKQEITYKLLRNAGMLAIARWAREQNMTAEVALAMKVIAISVDMEYRKLLSKGEK